MLIQIKNPCKSKDFQITHFNLVAYNSNNNIYNNAIDKNQTIIHLLLAI